MSQYHVTMARGSWGERTVAPGGNLLMGLFFALSDHFQGLGSVNLHYTQLLFGPSNLIILQITMQQNRYSAQGGG